MTSPLTPLGTPDDDDGTAQTAAPVTCTRADASDASEATDQPITVHEIARLTCSGESRPVIRSDRAARVARWFGIDRVLAPQRGKGRRAGPSRAEQQRQRRSFLADLAGAALDSGHVTLITGASGAGKSSLLRQLRHEHDKSIKWIDLARLDLPNRPLVDCFGPRARLPDVLLQLSCVGLGEAWSYLKTPRELSEGQRWRLRLALGLHQAERARSPGAVDRSRWAIEWKPSPDAPVEREPDTPATSDARADPDRAKTDPDFLGASGTSPEPARPTAVVVCDEFAAVLDRVTACVVSRALRRSIDHLPNLCAVVATSHEDLLGSLEPDVLVRCDFGKIVLEETGRCEEV